MAWGGKQTKGFRRASGAQIGAIAVKVYVCRGCGLQHRPEAPISGGTKLQKPVSCKSCGRMDFSTFDSMGEANRWAQLHLKVVAGMISELQMQVHFDLLAPGPNGMNAKVGEYWADFVYMRDGVRVIEDFKGAITDLAAWKLRHMAAQGMPVTIVT